MLIPMPECRGTDGKKVSGGQCICAAPGLSFGVVETCEARTYCHVGGLNKIVTCKKEHWDIARYQHRNVAAKNNNGEILAYKTTEQCNSNGCAKFRVFGDDMSIHGLWHGQGQCASFDPSRGGAHDYRAKEALVNNFDANLRSYVRTHWNKGQPDLAAHEWFAHGQCQGKYKDDGGKTYAKIARAIHQAIRAWLVHLPKAHSIQRTGQTKSTIEWEFSIDQSDMPKDGVGLEHWKPTFHVKA
jgi:hypothetical protein